MSEEQHIRQELAADGTEAGVEFENEQIDSHEPFDPEKISIDGKGVPMETLLRRLMQGSMRLAPAFQRKEVWDIQRKSQLIESLMLAIPIPMFYVAADEKGNWDVVDGLQRLSTIREFVLGDDYLKTKDEMQKGNGFKLKGLEYWGEKYNGLKFKNLHEKLSNRILETEFRFTIINPGTPEEVKRNIFKRINTGGMPLTSQEIRHALYQGVSTELLEYLSKTKSFKLATGGSVNDSRMAARELILRFMAFSIRSYKDYPKASDMDNFLCDTMRIINVLGSSGEETALSKLFRNKDVPKILIKSPNKIEERFETAMQRARKLFGEHAFRKSYDFYKRAPINKTLFEVWSNVLADLDSEQFEQLFKNKKIFMEEYSRMIDDDDFGRLIARDSWKHSGVQSRYTSVGDLVSKFIE